MITKLNNSQQIDITKRINRSENNVISKNNSISKNNKPNFSEILSNKKSQNFSLSKHAEERINSREISLNDSEKNMLSKAIDDVAEKGSKESLILLNDKSFIVNVKNRKIITAMNKQSSKSKIFTNIDSTIII